MAEQGDVRTAEMIQRLSELMRFTIYEGRKDYVPISAELNYLRNYLELSRMRYQQLDLRLDAKIEDETYPIPPLLLIILVENAVKHGAAAVADRPFIEIRLSIAAGRLTFVVENNRAPNRRHQPGIGMANLRRRLELQYPRRHSLKLKSAERSWRVELALEGRCVT